MVLATVACARRRSAGVVEGNGSGWSYGRVERVFGGAIDGYELGEAMGVLGWLGREAGEGNFRGAARSSASGEKKRKAGQPRSGSTEGSG